MDWDSVASNPPQWVLEDPQLIYKQWETMQSVDSDLETPQKELNILEDNGNNCGHPVTSGTVTSTINMSTSKQPPQCWSDKQDSKKYEDSEE
jgi:hypothetical protein